MAKHVGAVVAAIGLMALPGAASAQTYFGRNTAAYDGSGGSPSMGCTTTVNGQPAAWVLLSYSPDRSSESGWSISQDDFGRPETFQDGTRVVLVVPTRIIRGRFIDFTRHNQVIGNVEAERRAIENGEIPYLTGLAGRAPMQQTGLAQPLQDTEEARAIFIRYFVRNVPYSSEPFVAMSAAGLCTGTERPRFDGRDSTGGSYYTPRSGH